MTSRNANRSTVRPRTTRQTVNGVASTSPIGPHKAVQKVADTTTATGESPVLRPYTKGSMTCPTNGSIMKKSAAVQASIDQPGSTATAKTSGNAAEITEPM